TATTFDPSALGSGPHTIIYHYTNGSGCSDTASKVVYVKICTGIENIDLESAVAIYPNPANDELYLQSDLFAANNITPVVYDINGKAVSLSYTRLANKIRFATQNLAAGSYYIKLNINGLTVNKRFVKK
ncbi:MAG: hypothetical protein JWO06_4004, partial [Bacteroidota bacterium]|nr:hypothetical protein [Bacteroidota bacterium]